MTDTDRLAALLHDVSCTGWEDHERQHLDDAARLIAQGVRVGDDDCDEKVAKAVDDATVVLAAMHKDDAGGLRAAAQEAMDLLDDIVTYDSGDAEGNSLIDPAEYRKFDKATDILRAALAAQPAPPAPKP